MTDATVLTLVGSLRAASYNRKLAHIAATTAPAGLEVKLFEKLGHLPFYNEDIDIEGEIPDAVQALRAEVAQAGAVLLVLPEYNGTIPAVLKNAIDWLSRPYGAGALAGKPVAVIGIALGQYGGLWAHDEARKSVGIAGGQVIDGAALSVSVQNLGEGPLEENSSVITAIRGVLQAVAAAV
ncbi:MAG: NAD(P)H-dependent oxidoreductase [Mycobacteriaceae bacterium]